MRRVVSVLLALLAVVVVASTALAGEREGAFSASPFIGGYTFDGTQHLETAPVYGVRLGYDITSHLGVEAVSDFLYTHFTHSGRSKKMLSYRLDLLYNFMPEGPFVPYLAVGGGGLTYGGDAVRINGKNTDATANLGGGFKYFVTDSLALRGDARQLFVMEDPNKPKYNWEYSLGVTFLFGGSKPAVAQAVVAPAAAPAASPAPVAPAAPAVAAAPVAPVAPVEPAAPPAAAPVVALKVIPASITASQTVTLAWSSRNAVNCDLQPGFGPVQPEGSMTVTPTADTDYTLTCEGPGGRTASAGHLTVVPAPAPVVPAKAPVAEEDHGRTVTIGYSSASVEVAASYHQQLHEMARYLKAHPEKKGVISGYTDNIGSQASNQALSLRRAQAVKAFLVKQGVRANRLTVKGYGSANPVADNATSDGRQANRRTVVVAVP